MNLIKVVQDGINTRNTKSWLLLLFFGLMLNSCSNDSSEEDILKNQEEEEEEIIQNLDLDAAGDCKTLEMIITSGEIKETYQIAYNAQDKITQAIGSNGKYTFDYGSNSYSYKNYNASGDLTNTKEVQLNSDGKPISYTEKIYSDNGDVSREEAGTLTYTDGKIAMLEITLDDIPIKEYKMFWENGNITEIESAGYIDRRYEYDLDTPYPKDGLICIDLIGYLQTGIYYMGNNNNNLLKHSEVDGVISDFSYNFNDYGKVVSQRSIHNNLANPVYFTPTYSCK
ncbi:hypothetical protein GH721_03155 [Kriegella sp. EG-1]|nr:hypothetical protein [Flavobacteriaceae bacterium EG-1]